MGSSKNKKENDTTARPYDKIAFDECEKCEGVMVYRKSSCFGKVVFYLICNECGYHKIIQKEEWKKKTSQEIPEDDPE